MKTFEKRAREKGIQLGAYTFQEFRGDWPATFDQFAKDGVKFVMYVDPKRDTDGHGKLTVQRGEMLSGLT